MPVHEEVSKLQLLLQLSMQGSQLFKCSPDLSCVYNEAMVPTPLGQALAYCSKLLSGLLLAYPVNQKSQIACACKLSPQNFYLFADAFED